MEKCPECGWPKNPRETRETCWRFNIDQECRRGLVRELYEQLVFHYDGPKEPEYKNILGEDRWVR